MPSDTGYLFTIAEEHVGKAFVKIGTRTVSLSDAIGRAQKSDTGKRVYVRNGVVQVENDEQRATRMSRSCHQGRECLSPVTHRIRNYYTANSPAHRMMGTRDRLLCTSHAREAKAVNFTLTVEMFTP